MSSAAQMVKGKAILQGKDTVGAAKGGNVELPFVCLDGSVTDISKCNNKVEVSFGYPAATTDGILKVLDIAVSHKDSVSSDSEWIYNIQDWKNGGLKQILISFKGFDFPKEGYKDDDLEQSKGCYIMYDMPVKATPQKIIIEDSKC